MKKIYLLLLFIFTISSSQAQSYSGPESVEYDSAYGRWLVGNHSNGTVLSLSPGSGTLLPFCSGVTSGPYGIEILDTVLYCCSGGYVRGFSLSNGLPVFNVNLGASFLNGICSDGGSNLFLTDFTSKKIYRLNVLTSSFNVMVSGLSKSPNGIVYDGPNNRCVFVNWGSAAPIMAMNLADSTTSILVTSSLTNIDGITRDPAGNWYVSAWGNNGLNRFNSTFTGGSTPVMTGLSSPADLGINSTGDSIAIPNSGSGNNVVFYHICTSTTLVAGFTSSANGPVVQFTNTTTGGTPSGYDWNFGDGGTSTLQSPPHTYSGGGTFYVCLIVTDICGSDTICDSVTVTATTLDHPVEKELFLFPNPTDGIIHLHSDLSQEVVLEIFDLKGMLLKQEMIKANSEKIISLEGMGSGVYFYECKDQENNQVLVGKVVVR